MKYLGSILIAAILFGCNAKQNEQNKKPNVIVVFTDDQGYQDLGCYGSPDIKTPNIDKMASEGIRYTDFYVASSVCSPSRAALLTGKIPKNSGVPFVYFQDQPGMKPEQVTLAEVLKTANYRTACFGKWHLGDQKGNLPTDQGFDEYYGIPYSNDMSIGSTHEFAEHVTFNDGYTLEKAKEDQLLVKQDREKGKKPWEQGKRNIVPVFEGDKIVEYPAEQGTLTQRYFDKTIDFIEKDNEKPFFVYVTPAMPHIPLYASEQFEGKSENGLYGDVIEEIDYYMGKLLNYLKDAGLDKNTLVIYASDNGPWLQFKDHAGSALPLRDGKMSNYEGGVRVPGIFWFPGHINEPMVSNNVSSTTDILPTVAALANIDISNIAIDGKILPELVKSAEAKQQYIYSSGPDVWGVRKGDWKYLRHSGKKWAGKNTDPELYNLKEDISEQNNLLELNPEKVEELTKFLNEYDK